MRSLARDSAAENPAYGRGNAFGADDGLDDLGLLSLATFVADELSAVGSAHPRPKPELTQPLSLRNPMWVMCCHDPPLPLRYTFRHCESRILSRKCSIDKEKTGGYWVILKIPLRRWCGVRMGVVLYRGVRSGMLSGK